VDLDGDGINDLLSGSWPGEIYFFKGHGHGQFDLPVTLKDQAGNVLKVGSASAVFAADLKGDGRLDLIVGDIDGNVWFIPNEGTAKAWAFGSPQHLRAGIEDIKVEGDAGPTIADWDGDGKPDLLCGSADGSVRFYRNTGKVDPHTKLPILAAPRVLVPASSEQGAEPGKPPTRGIRSKICVTDWNGDGKPDLLLGDFSIAPQPLGDAPPEQRYHGWVWVYLRKP
jgi:hypothetical protein